MAQLRFGVDELGKEILELVPTPRVAERDTERNVAQEGDGSPGNRCCHESDKPYKGENTIVMMEWEKPYMRGLVDALRITEQTDVLEIGFGCGYSADRIQEMKPRSHTVVEPDPVVLGRLKVWAAGGGGARQERVKVVEGFWQTALPALGRFDAIFFDDFPLPGTPDSSDLRGPESRWHAFIDLCVAHHLHVGGRITGYLARPLCLARPGCDAAPLVPFPVEVPPNCSYFPYREAYIPLVTRRAEGVSDTGLGSKKGIYDASHPLVMDYGNPSSSSTTIRTSRKRQKRLLLEALVKERLGLGDGRGTGDSV